MRPDGETHADNKMDELAKAVDELRQIKEKLQKSEEMYRFLAENSVDAIWRLDAQFKFVYVSPAAKNIFGYQAEEIIGQHLFSILTKESIKAVTEGFARRKTLQENKQRWGSSTYTVETIHKDGHYIWVEVTVNPIFDADNQLTGYNGITRDISERRRNEEVIRQYAFRDPLTNLPNRRMFEDVLADLVVKNKKNKKTFAVMFLDVDGLKEVNDIYGHNAGDFFLQTVAARLYHGMRKKDFIARLAGDEFMAILPGIGDICAVNSIVSRLFEHMRQAIVFGNNQAQIGVSIGISFFPHDADNAIALMNNADQAMYTAKKNGGNGYVCYNQRLEGSC